MRIVFMGSPDFAVPALQALIEKHEVCLVVTKPDKPSGRGKKLTPPAVKPIAEAAGIPILQPKSARTPEFAQAMRDSGAELAVVVAYGKILPNEVLEAFPRGCLNIHGSLLPKYRGAAPIQWAVIRGEKESGVSIMQLDEGMDTGPVFLKKVVALREGETAGSLFDRLAPLGAEALIEALEGIEAGTLVAKAQDESQASHAPMLKKADGLVDWNQPAKAVVDRICGMDPWPGSHTTCNGKPLKLFGAQLVEGEGKPGELLSCDTAGMVVACAEGACRILEVQPAGKRRMAAHDFACGRRIESGSYLGQDEAR